MRSGAKIFDFCAREVFRPDDMKDEELDLNMSNSELHALPVALMRQVAVAPSASGGGHNRLMKSTRGELQPEQWGPSGGIDRHLWRLKDLRALRLDHNFISSLGLLDCERIKRLQVLDLSHNQLKAFSAKHPIVRSLFTLTNLRELNLRGNRIDRLPQEVSQLTNLTLLDLSDNRFEEIPSSLISLSGSLRHLFLAHNRTLENFDFPSSINYLTNLRRLDVQGNNFHSLPMSLFEKLVHLEELSLSENFFAALPPCAPHGLSALHKLDLSRLRLNDFSFPQQVIVRSTSFTFALCLHFLLT
jgi:Leucine-rich repeat (LRR) protein